MKIHVNKLIKLLLLGYAAIHFTGCASWQAMSSYARTGDTVTIALGSTDEGNALVEILKKEDISVSITDANSNTYPIKLRKLFRTYADNTSRFIVGTNQIDNALQYDWESYHAPLTGQWMAIIDLVDPDTGSLPLLAAGSATISVTSADQLIPFVPIGPYSFAWSDGNLSSIAIEILPGEGVINDLKMSAITFDPVTALEPLSQILVKPNGIPSVELAGGSFKFIYNATNFDFGVKAVPFSHDPNVQISSSVTDLENGTKQLHVLIMNPKGFKTDNLRGSQLGIGEKSPFRSIRISLVWKGGATVTDANWQNFIQMAEGQYIDIAGNSVDEITPIMDKIR